MSDWMSKLTPADVRQAITELDYRIEAALNDEIYVDDVDLDEWLELSNVLSERLEAGYYE